MIGEAAMPVFGFHDAQPCAGSGVNARYWEGRNPIAVQAIGGPIPHWAKPGFPGKAPDSEIVIVRAKAPISDQAGVEAKHRVMLIEETLGRVPLPECGFAIQARGTDLELVAEAVLRVIVSDVFMGICLYDLWFARPWRDPDFQCANRGRAVVLDGLCSGSMAPAARQALDGLGRKGFGGGVFLGALVGREDSAAFTLEDIDALITTVMADDDVRDRAITAALGASRSAVVIVAFEKADAPRSDA